MSSKPIIITLIVGVILIILGLATGICWTLIYNIIMKSQLSLTPTSTNFELWKETPIPMYLKLYLFHWTNPGDFNAKSTRKPNFLEMGPYVFKQVDYKVNRIWNDNDTITFQRKRLWEFDKSLSKGDLTDKVTNLNPVAATVAYSFRHKSKFVRDLVGRLMVSLGHKITVTKTVKELLFDGYDDSMLLISKKLNLSAMPYTKFGWFYARNNSETYDGTFNMDTGVSDFSQLGMIKEWNFSSRTKNYPDQCGLITGSNGELWPPMEDRNIASVFVTDICTNLNLEYEELTTYQGLIGKKYHATKAMLDNGDDIPERKCYCKDIECVPSGTLNISLCKYNAPIFVSMPHFYLADSSYLDAITGLEPEKPKHEMSMVLQPLTGVPMQVNAQLQLNMLVQPDSEMRLFKDVKRTFIPMMWFTQEANLTPDYAKKVKFLLILQSLGSVTCYGIAAIGFLITFIGVFLFVRQRWQGDDTLMLLSREAGFETPRTIG